MSLSMRITTRGLFRNYSSNLVRNTNRLNESMERVETQRKFNSYAEDPAAASRAFQLRRSFWRTGDQIDNTNYIISKFQTAWSAMDAVIEGNETSQGLSGITATLEALNDPSAASRISLGQDLLTSAESVVRMMNVQYGDEFIFAGADGLNVPFSWGDDGETLYYRGVDVNIPKPDSMKDFGVDSEMLKMEKPLSEEEFETSEAYSAYKADYADRNGISFSTATSNYAKVEEFNKYKADFEAEYGVDYNKVLARYDEATYVDIGIGMQLDEKGSVIPTSAYNSAVSGLEILGYGLDEDGDPKNLALILHELGSIFVNCDPETGKLSADDAETAQRLGLKLHSALGAMSEEHTKLSAKVDYLNTNVALLNSTKDQLNEQIMDVEQMDSAEAITEMLWAQYSYNAALRIGTNLLSQSLIDYMT